MALAILAGVTVLVALVSEVFVESVQQAAVTFGMSPAFVGFIVVALVGGAAEMASAFSGARKNRLDLSVGIALGSASQIALFVAPVLVLLSYVIGPTPMDLRFWTGAVVMMLIATFTATLVTNSGRSAWFVGALVLMVYFIFAMTLYLLPPTGTSRCPPATDPCHVALPTSRRGTQDEMRTLIHLSDLHFGRIDPGILDPLRHAVHDAKPHLVAISGDFTQRARRSQFAAARAFMDTLEPPKLVVPGNHDVPYWNVARRFLQPLTRYRRYISEELEPEYQDEEMIVLGVNTARAFAHGGGRINCSAKWTASSAASPACRRR